MDLNTNTASGTMFQNKLAPSWSHGSKCYILLKIAPLPHRWLPRGAMDLNVDGGYKKNEWRLVGSLVEPWI